MTHSISRSPLSNMQRRSGVSVQPAPTRSRAMRALSEADRRQISEILSNEQDYIDSEEFRKDGA